jgi:putative ATP-dependent endonuclease of OLD family
VKITRLEVHNFRNLDGAIVLLDNDCSFIVGENNLGKSNLLHLLDTIFSRRSFAEEDFQDATKPIEVMLRLKLAEIEIGHFQDLFDIDDYTGINVVCRQVNVDENIEFSHLETKTSIQPSAIRCANYIHYDSLRNPVAEIRFDKDRGVGRFLKNLISQYLKTGGVTDKDFLESEKVDALVEAVNDKLLKIKSFKDFGISAVADEDLESLLPKVLILRDGTGGTLAKAGYGVQFLILVTLSILERIQSIMRQRKDRGIFEDGKTGEKALSLVLGFDEPEIHLHPYIQRALMKFLCAVINNKNEDFGLLIKELFSIDRLIGQIIIVTQSPNIISNEYRQIVRFYLDNNSLKIVSGTQLTLNPQLQKHLYLNLPFIKEAFFSRCAVFVEGDSEYASLPLFAQKHPTPVDLDDLGICVIQAHGNAVPHLIELASLFGIPSVGLTDKDTGTIVPSIPNHYQTNLRDFEEELVSHILGANGEATLRRIVTEYDSRGPNREIQAQVLNRWALRTYSVVPKEYTNSLKLADIANTDLINLKAYYLTWFAINKSYPLGKLIGETLSQTEIPTPYRDIVTEALKLVQNV